MHEIDFLPAEYRQKNAGLQSQPWRLVVLGLVGALVVAAALTQSQRRKRLETELDEITPKYDAMVACNQGLEVVQQDLDTARADAELFTYLRHRWPATRVLDVLLAPLPEQVVFEHVEIRRETPSGRHAARPVSPEDRDSEAQRLAALPAAARDLAELRGECDTVETVVTLTGTTTDSAALHCYLGQLGRIELFAKAELDTIDSELPAAAYLHAPSNGPAIVPQLRFSARLVVRPGYGLPGGPAPETCDTSEDTDQPTT